VLLQVVQTPVPSDEQIVATLRALEVEGVLTRVGGLDSERDWDNSLSLGEQQLLTVARIILASPTFVLLDRVSTSLEPAEISRIQRAFAAHSITYMTFAKGDSTMDSHDAVLALAPDGSWNWEKHTENECPAQP
jgi:putative ATP-binding cassette transporter